MTTDVLTLITAQLSGDRRPEEVSVIDFDRFEPILERFRSDISIATENAYLALEKFKLDTTLVYHDHSNKVATSTKRELFERLLTFPKRLEDAAADALGELEDAGDETAAGSAIGFFQIAGLELIQEIERFSLATEQTKETVAQ